MNKNQVVFVVGGLVLTGIGAVSTLYVGKKSYKKGFAAGADFGVGITKMYYELKTRLNKTEMDEVMEEFQTIVQKGNKES